jgi:hypothetical protein
MMYQTPGNVEELQKLIADLEWESISQKEEIGKSAALFMHNLKPINILKNALQPVSNGFIGKWAGKLLLGYKKLTHRRAEVIKPVMISKY